MCGINAIASTSTTPIRASRHTPQQQQRSSARMINSRITSLTRGIRRRNEEVECNNQLRAAKTMFRLFWPYIPSSSTMAHGSVSHSQTTIRSILSHRDNVTINQLIAMQQTKHHGNASYAFGGLLEVCTHRAKQTYNHSPRAYFNFALNIFISDALVLHY